MADALDAEQFDGFANFLRAANFAGVHQLVQTDLCGAVIDGTKFLGGDGEFVAADAEGSDGFRMAAVCGFDDFHRCVHAELARGIEHPSELKSATFEWFGGVEKSLEVCFR